jgi:penicillin-binding protein 2
MSNFSRIKNDDYFSAKSSQTSKLDDYSFRLEWTEDSYIEGANRQGMVGRSFNPRKAIWLKIFLFFLFAVLLSRLAWLQLAKGSYYYLLAEGNRIRNERIEAKRGIAYDRNFKPLVKNEANFVLYSLPCDLPRDEGEQKEMFGRLSELLGGKPSVDELVEITSKIKRGSLESYRPLFIADNLDYERAMLLYLETSNFPGIAVSNKNRRDYQLYSLSLSHIMGYTGKINEEELKNYGDEYLPIDYIGKTGLEYFYENELKGSSGVKQIEVDALGKEKKIINATDPQDGHNLLLSLDVDLQKKIEETAGEYMKQAKASRASIVALDPRNGEVLALVSLPSYNNNFFAKGINTEEYNKLINHPDSPLFNRAISGEFPSGSTIKPVMAAAALEEKIITEYTTFLSTGGIRIGQWFFPDWKAGGHGLTEVKNALAWSVNTFFYIIGGGLDDFVGLGVDKIVHYETLFGLGSQLGIDLPGEASGFLPSKEWKEKTKGEKWYIGDTYHLSIGQGDLLVTPLQVADYTAFFANGGNLYRPHLVKEILNSKDEVLKVIEPEKIRQNFISGKNIDIVREGMRDTVTLGSAKILQDVPVPVAGKTGTAQWATDKPTHAWFTGFAPYDNPEIAITVLVEQGGEGSTVATPIVNDVLKWYFGGRPTEDLVK